MSPNKFLLAAALAGAVFFSACNCGGNPPPPGEEDSGTGGTEDSGTTPPGDGGTGMGDGGSDAGEVTVPTNPFDPTNTMKDSDCDGLTDQEEYANTFAGGKKTDPGRSDTDGDGIKDGVELGRTTSVNAACGFMGDADAATRTVPTEADSDADGVSDGLEDGNRNGRVDSGETDPANPDSDGDAIKDGDEDANRNGAVDVGETNPRTKDTDTDGIGDGIEKTVTLTDPLKIDTDGDGCNDGLEDLDQDGMVDAGETNPKNAMDCGPANIKDTDMDGIPDLIEDANSNMTWDQATETNFNAKDTDGDGLEDGLEDRNKNGQFEPGETNPRRIDTDCDGLIDGPTNAGMSRLGEDQNSNGMVDGTETDPRKRDSDGDGVRDGVELGVTVNPDATGCPDFIADADPSTTTTPTSSDTDGDGISDGAEDGNQNGRVDPGELNPKNSMDVIAPDGGLLPTAKVCTADTLRPVIFREAGAPDIQIGVPSSFTEIVDITIGGEVKGLMGYSANPADASDKVAFLVFRRGQVGASTTPTADETGLRPQLQGVGGVTNAVIQTFDTWDGYKALTATYDQAGTVDLKDRANAIAVAMIGAGAGALPGMAGVTGPFKIQAEYVHRSNSSVVVLIAITPAANFKEPGIFTVGDTAAGSALAQFGDANAIQCEPFTPSNGVVDFLFVVDDSCSMANKQQALANSANTMATSLSNSTLDWRLALVTTNYHFGTSAAGNNVGKIRGFTRNVNLFRAWLSQGATCQTQNCAFADGGGFPSSPCGGADGGFTGANNGCWIGTGGAGEEGLLGAARKATDDLTPASATEQANRLRPGAQLVVVLLGDADDMTNGYTSTLQYCGGANDNSNGTGCTPAARFSEFFTATGTFDAGTRNKLERVIPVHGIICPAGADCGDFRGANPQRHAAVITATNGIRGDICAATGCPANGAPPPGIAPTMQSIVNSSIGAAGHRTAKPPIGASIKVAMDAVLNPMVCDRDDIKRSRLDGFDFDAISRTISFFGGCRPSASSSAAAVSYRYWIDTTTNPNGSPPPCSTDPYFDPNEADFCRARLVCNRVTNVCECPEGCGAVAPAGKVCNQNKQVCDFVCTPDCGGTCSGYQTCNTTSCGCQCATNATCAPGFKFQNGAGVCGCVCDTDALGCGPKYNTDAASCSCVCKSDCGGCAQGTTCNASTCTCQGTIG